MFVFHAETSHSSLVLGQKPQPGGRAAPAVWSHRLCPPPRPHCQSHGHDVQPDFYTTYLKVAVFACFPDR